MPTAKTLSGDFPAVFAETVTVVEGDGSTRAMIFNPDQEREFFRLTRWSPAIVVIGN